MPRPALISRAVILDETLALADERGLAAVTMRTVAARLGVTAMSLYHHVRDKNDLLDGLVERLFAALSLPDPSLAGRGATSARLHAACVSRLPVIPMPSVAPRRPVATPSAALAVRDVAYAALRDAGIPDELVPRAERLLSTFVIGFAASEVGGRFAAHDQAVRDADFELLLLEIVARLEGLVVAEPTVIEADPAPRERIPSSSGIRRAWRHRSRARLGASDVPDRLTGAVALVAVTAPFMSRYGWDRDGSILVVDPPSCRLAADFRP